MSAGVPAYVVVEAFTAVYKLAMDLLALNRSGVAHHVQCASDLLHDFLWRKIGSMQIDRKVREANLVKPTQYYIQRSAFFRHKQNALPRSCQTRDQMPNNRR
jgi:hypothetical protein